MDGGGAIGLDEFALMLRVMGCSIDRQQVRHVMDEAKDGFKAWKKMADEENIAKCKRIWDEYDTDKSGTMDLKEVNVVIEKLKELGSDPDPMKASDVADGELDFDEFSAWFLKQEGLPDSFAPPVTGPAGGLNRKREKGMLGKVVQTALMPLTLGSKIALAPVDLLAESAKKIAKATLDKDTGHLGAEAAMQAAMENQDQLIFAEFVFMMRAGLLKQFLADDWQERAEDMRKLREAFDCADVDGNNKLELV